MSCAILNQLAPPSRLYWIIRRSLFVMLVLSHLISWTLPINQTSPPFGWRMVSGGAVGVGVGVGDGVGYCPQYLPPVFTTGQHPPQTIISLPVQTAVGMPRAEGALVVLVAVQLSVLGLYLPPVFKRLPFESVPPQTIIALPVQTAVCSCRAEGALIVVVAVHVSVPGLYLPPVFERPPASIPP